MQRGQHVAQGLQGLTAPSFKRGPGKLFGTRVLGLAGSIRLELDPGVTEKKQSSAHVGVLSIFMQNMLLMRKMRLDKTKHKF